MPRNDRGPQSHEALRREAPAPPVAVSLTSSLASAGTATAVRQRLSLPVVQVIVGVVALTALAAAIRLWAFDRVPPNPFYDAAVRSMSLSWRNLFFGALEPGGSVSIDKPPIDLWLQVASVKALGFTSVALRLPQAIAGTLAVPILYDLVRRGFGQPAGLVAGASLAVLPAAVLTGRSDTMDTLMGTLLLAAAWVIVAAPARYRGHAVVAAGALAGLAFEVKLFEVAVALPALVVLAVVALRRSRSDWRRVLLGAGAAFLVAAASWPLAASLAPGPHPWPAGSTDGSIANVILVYNGANRLGYPAPGSFSASLPAPSPVRLFLDGPDHYWKMLGVELLPALVLFGIVALRRLNGMRGPVGAGIGVWLLCGYAFFSLQGRPRVRYLEAFTPSVAGALGIGLVGAVGVLAGKQGGRPGPLRSSPPSWRPVSSPGRWPPQCRSPAQAPRTPRRWGRSPEGRSRPSVAISERTKATGATNWPARTPSSPGRSSRATAGPC